MSKKTEEKIEPVVVEPAKPVKPVKRWNTGSIFWGALLVLIGTLFLLDNLNVVQVNFANVWQLWPVLIIGAGLSLLSLKGWVGALVSFVAAAALLGLVTFAVVENPWYPGLRTATTQTTTESVAVVTAKKMEVSINTGAATIDLSSSQDEKGVTVVQKSNGLELTKSTEVKDDTQHTSFESKLPKGMWFGGVKNDMNVTLTRSVATSLKIDTGATTVKGDLSQVRLALLDIDAGASTIDVKLGSLESRQEIKIEAGVSSILLHVPKQAGLRIDSDNGLSSTQFEGVSKVSDSMYESDAFDKAEKQITVRADIGVSKFEIKRY